MMVDNVLHFKATINQLKQKNSIVKLIRSFLYSEFKIKKLYPLPPSENNPDYELVV